MILSPGMTAFPAAALPMHCRFQASTAPSARTPSTRRTLSSFLCDTFKPRSVLSAFRKVKLNILRGNSAGLCASELERDNGVVLVGRSELNASAKDNGVATDGTGVGQALPAGGKGKSGKTGRGKAPTPLEKAAAKTSAGESCKPDTALGETEGVSPERLVEAQLPGTLAVVIVGRLRPGADGGVGGATFAGLATDSGPCPGPRKAPNMVSCWTMLANTCRSCACSAESDSCFSLQRDSSVMKSEVCC
mmetsp:Transcript_429/g.665  ORF Transcript_429/g.665 Transcript_429/m.665 type:complete len:248 (+) Transcript_429:458-1201(+)